MFRLLRGCFLPCVSQSRSAPSVSPKDSRAAMAGLEAVAQNGAAAKDGIWGGTPGV